MEDCDIFSEDENFIVFKLGKICYVLLDDVFFCFGDVVSICFLFIVRSLRGEVWIS